MKKSLLLIFLISASSMMSQVFSSGEQTLLTNLSFNIRIDGNTNKTTLTLKGPSNAWFAIGFGALNMSSGADVLRTDGTTIIDAKSSSRVNPPADTSQDWSLESNTVDGNVRTIVATRDNDTGDSDDFVFSPQEGSIPIIYAHGTSTSYGYHGGTRGFTTIGVLSSKQEELLSFETYPNPAIDFVNVQLSSDIIEADVMVFDVSGRLVKSQQINIDDTKLNISDLSKGIYFLTISSDNKTGTQKFIKQ